MRLHGGEGTVFGYCRGVKVLVVVFWGYWGLPSARYIALIYCTPHSAAISTLRSELYFVYCNIANFGYNISYSKGAQ